MAQVAEGAPLFTSAGTAGGESKHTSFDYSLPPAFVDCLVQPYTEVIDALLGPLKPGLVNEPKADEPEVAFISAMKSAGDTFTDKGALAHKSTDSPLVELFYEFTPGVTSVRLFELLGNAWKKDAKSTFQIILQGRSIHEGKSMEEETLKALAWVWENHPRTMLANLHLLVDPTCKRHKSKAREEAKAKKAAEKVLKDGKDVIALGNEDEMEVETLDEEVEHEYPPRPHGAFKDLIDLLILALNGQLSTTYTGRLSALNESIAPASVRLDFKNARLHKAAGVKNNKRPQYQKLGRVLDKAAEGTGENGEKGAGQPWPIGTKPPTKTKQQRREEKKAKEATFQQELHVAKTKKARHRLMRARLHDTLADKKFVALYLTVVKLFADAIRDDLVKLKEHRDQPEGDKSQLFGLSFAAKWVPSPTKGGDKQLFFATALSKVLFPTEAEDWMRRERLQREVLSPLRAALKVPETKMLQGAWNIDYTSVPGRAMKRHAAAFMKHDPQGFGNFLRKAQQGHIMIAGASMMPHELLITERDPMIKQLADLQWRSLVDSIRSSAAEKLTNCIAVADVSGSMGYLQSPMRGFEGKAQPQPIQVCIALTLLLGELAEAPWSGSFFTFDTNPTFMTIDTSLPLSERAEQLAQAPWGGSTEFGKTFDLILETAQRQKLKPEQMVKTLFVFSDMQFDQAADRHHGETEHQTARRKFEEAGYPFPEMVYWNLAGAWTGNGGTSKPVKADTEGVALMSGFSGALMKYFLGQAGEDEDMEGEDGEEEDKEKGEDEDDGWEKVGQNGEGVISEGLAQTQIEEAANGDGKENGKDEAKEKKKKNPMDHVKKILRAESFQGVVIVD